MTLQLGWFSTGRGPGSYGMLHRVLRSIHTGELDACVQFVYSNRERGEGEGSDHFFDMVESNGIPLLSYSFRKFRRAHGGEFDPHRTEYDSRVLDLLSPYGPDLCILAGYLLILSPALCRSHVYLNLHPALPGGPKGLWQPVLWDVIAGHVPETGVMTFRVTEAVDEGPPVTFTRFPLTGPPFDDLWSRTSEQDIARLRAARSEDHPLFQAIRQEEVRREPVLLLETLKAFASGDLRIHRTQVVDASLRPAPPHDLTASVEAMLLQEE